MIDYDIFIECYSYRVFYRIALIEEKIYTLRKKGAEPQEINRLVKTLKEANNQLKKAEYETIYGDKNTEIYLISFNVLVTSMRDRF